MWLALSSLVVATAGADWATAFEPKAIATYLDRENAAVVVVAGGAGGAEAQAAELALVAALRASGQARLVMSSDSISGSPSDKDSELVKKAAALPIDLVVVLRLFPGATTDAAPVAVATIYDTSAEAVSAMAATRGVPLTARETNHQSVGRAAVARSIREGSGPRIVGAPPKPPEHPKKIGFTAVSKTGEAVTWVGTPTQGGRRLSNEEFFTALSRPDLLAKQRGLGIAKSITIGTGITAMVGSLALFIAGLAGGCAVYDASRLQCLQSRNPTLLPAAGVMGGAGAVLAVVGALINTTVLNDQQRYDLAHTYNQKLGVAP